jgi:predicted esterase
MLGEHAKKLPIFWGHGLADPLVRYEFAQRSTAFLDSSLGIGAVTGDSNAGLEFHSYAGLDHSASEEELGHLQTWLAKVLPPAN